LSFLLVPHSGTDITRHIHCVGKALFVLITAPRVFKHAAPPRTWSCPTRPQTQQVNKRACQLARQKVPSWVASNSCRHLVFVRTGFTSLRSFPSHCQSTFPMRRLCAREHSPRFTSPAWPPPILTLPRYSSLFARIYVAPSLSAKMVLWITARPIDKLLPWTCISAAHQFGWVSCLHVSALREETDRYNNAVRINSCDRLTNSSPATSI
jgi:hypothetical protein